MNKIENNKSHNIKPDKTPQWIRDIATSSKLNKSDVTSQGSSRPLITTGNFNIKKTSNSAKGQLPDNSNEQLKYTDRIKKARERLIKIDQLKQEADNRNIEIEQSIKQEEENIEQKIFKRFKT